MALILFIVLVAVVLGIIGFVIKGLLWLLAIGVIVLIADLIFAGTRLGGRRRAR